MRTSAFRAVLVWVLPLVTLGALACGGAPAPAPVAAAPPPAPAPAPPPPDLSAVPDPAGLVLSGGLANVGASLAMAHSFSQLPMPQSEQLSELLTGEAIGPVIDVEQPVYFALAIVGSGMRMAPPQVAVSAAVKDPDKVRAALSDRYKLVPGANGTTIIQGLGRPAHPHPAADEDDDDDDDKSEAPNGGDMGSDDSEKDGRTCELAASPGTAPVRIVCGISEKALANLGPWLTRTAPRSAPAADLHAEVRMEPLKQTISEGKMVMGMLLGTLLSGTLHVAWGKELLLAAAGDVADFASDLDAVNLDITLADSGATERASLAIPRTSSLLARVATSHAERVGAPPAAFWRMPADADLAVFTRGLDEDAISHARQLVVDALAGGLVEDGAKAADASAVASAFGKLLTGVPMVYARGLDVDAARKAVAAERAIGPDTDPVAFADAKHKAAETLLGWHVIEVDQKSAIVARALKDLAGAMGRASLLSAMRAKNKEAQPLLLRSAPLGKAGLAAGTTHWVLEIPPASHKPKADSNKAKKPLPSPKPMLVHVFVVPDGDRAWIGMGGDDVAIASRLATLATGKAGLDTRPELSSLKTASVGSAGFVTVQALAQASAQLRGLGGGSSSGASESLQDLAQMPQKGMTPIVLSTTATPGALTAQISAPRGAIEDLVGAILRHAGP